MYLFSHKLFVKNITKPYLNCSEANITSMFLNHPTQIVYKIILTLDCISLKYIFLHFAQLILFSCDFIFNNFLCKLLLNFSANYFLFFPKLFVGVFTEMFVNLPTQVIHKNNYYINYFIFVKRFLHN